MEIEFVCPECGMAIEETIFGEKDTVAVLGETTTLDVKCFNCDSDEYYEITITTKECNIDAQ